MKLEIYILNGPLKGQKLAVEKGLVFSRNKGAGCFFIKDSAASNPHAEVVKKKQKFYLQDMDSKNGTRVLGKINDFFPLQPDLIFQIGKTRFKIVDKTPKPLEPAKKQKPIEHWSVLLKKEFKRQKMFVSDREVKLIAFNPLLVLDFQSGVQKFDSWLIGYGPRSAGGACVDLPIWDPLAPDKCFVLEPKEGGTRVLFKTPYPEKIMINKQNTTEKILESGDLISFAGTGIKVSFQSKNKKNKTGK